MADIYHVLMGYALTGDIKGLKLYLTRNKMVLSSITENLIIPFIGCSTDEDNCKKCITQLVKHGANLYSKNNDDIDTLEYAMLNNRKSIVKFLITTYMYSDEYLNNIVCKFQLEENYFTILCNKK